MGFVYNEEAAVQNPRRKGVTNDSTIDHHVDVLTSPFASEFDCSDSATQISEIWLERLPRLQLDLLVFELLQL